MPTFEFTSPEGQKYSIDGPDGATRDEAFKMLQMRIAHEKEQKQPDVLKDVAMQAVTGPNEALANTAGAPVDAMTWLLNKGIHGVNSVAQAAGYDPVANDIKDAFGGSQSIKNAMGLIGANPDNALPQTPEGQIARSVSGTAAAALLPEAGVAGLAKAGLMSPRVLQTAQALVGDGSNVARTAISGAGAGAGSELAGQATEGSPLQPVAKLAGGLIGGGLGGAIAGRGATAPTTALKNADELEALYKQGINSTAVRTMGLKPQDVSALGDTIENTMRLNGARPLNNPKTFAALNELRGFNGPVSFDDINSVRKAFGEIAKDTQDFKPTADARTAIRGQRAHR
jgi:hypothetical protein